MCTCAEHSCAWIAEEIGSGAQQAPDASCEKFLSLAEAAQLADGVAQQSLDLSCPAPTRSHRPFPDGSTTTRRPKKMRLLSSFL